MVEKRVLTVAGVNYPVNVHVEKRGSTRVSITQTGVHIRVPRFLSISKRESEISKLVEWAVRKIKVKPTLKEKIRKYEHGGYIKTHGKIYQIDVERRESEKNFSKIDGNLIRFMISNKHDNKKTQEYMSKQARKLLAKAHLPELQNHVNRLNEQHFNKEVGKISYRYTKSRWGVCKSRTKDIELSTRLLLAPLPILEYVIIHELAHLIQQNHSRDFWNIVRSVDESYKEKINWLKKNGRELVL